MPPEQAVEQVEEFNRIKHNETKIPVEEARRQLLRNSGYNPEDWTFYSNTSRDVDQTDEEMMEELARNFPEGVEFLLIQGEFIGGVSGNPGTISIWGVARYIYNPKHHTAFIRVRPKQLTSSASTFHVE